MTTSQAKLCEFLEITVAELVSHGYQGMADKTSRVAEAIYHEEYVWAIILADAYGMGSEFIEKLRIAFHVGRIK